MVTTLAALLAVGPAQAVGSGSARPDYAGATAQKHPMSMTLKRGARRVNRLVVRVDAVCSSSHQVRWEALEIDDTKVGRDGRFSDGGVVEGNTHVGNTVLNFTVEVKGRIGARRAKGTVRLAGTVRDSSGKIIDKCDSGVARWTLRRGRVYAGITKDGTAVAVTTTRTRRTLKSFWIDVLVACGDQGDIQSRRHVNVSVDANGRFARQGAVSFATPQGPTVHGQFSLKGRVGARKASGTYRATATAQLPSGSTLTCASGVVKWSARRG